MNFAFDVINKLTDYINQIIESNPPQEPIQITIARQFGQLPLWLIDLTNNVIDATKLVARYNIDMQTREQFYALIRQPKLPHQTLGALIHGFVSKVIMPNYAIEARTEQDFVVYLAIHNLLSEKDSSDIKELITGHVSQGVEAQKERYKNLYRDFTQAQKFAALVTALRLQARAA
jgi:hypothetical protein